MLNLFLFALAAGLLLALLSTAIWAMTGRRRDSGAAIREFQESQPSLQQAFQKAASESAPRGLRLVDCEFSGEPLFAKDKNNGNLRGFLSVTIRFEAIPGGDMEDNPNVANLRAATALFHQEKTGWRPDGKILYNLEPADAIERFSHELTPIESPQAR